MTAPNNPTNPNVQEGKTVQGVHGSKGGKVDHPQRQQGWEEKRKKRKKRKKKKAAVEVGEWSQAIWRLGEVEAPVDGAEFPGRATATAVQRCRTFCVERRRRGK